MNVKSIQVVKEFSEGCELYDSDPLMFVGIFDMSKGKPCTGCFQEIDCALNKKIRRGPKKFNYKEEVVPVVVKTLKEEAAERGITPPAGI